MIDTHCHLTDPRLGSQLEDVLARAAAAGVGRMITISTSAADARQCIQLCKGRLGVRCSVGVHPGYVDKVELEDLAALGGLAVEPGVLAVGEIGLDYHHGRELRDRQLVFFNGQLNLAAEMRLPVIIHSRDAVDDCLDVMKGFPDVAAVFHCFTGTLAESRRILDAGYLIGFTGPITYKKSDDLRSVVRSIPLDRLLVETDAPYLSPEPLRKQKVCEPAFVVHTAAMMGQLKGISVEEVDRLTTENATRLFGWA